jgi:prepilin-type N-terminal cleavage/methylation domain-containing protein
MTISRCSVFGVRCSVFDIRRWIGGGACPKISDRIPNPEYRTPKRPAFTLIELLLAMTLLAIIAGGMAMAFSTSLRAAASIQQRAGDADERRKLVDQLRADLEGVYLRSGAAATAAAPAAAGTAGAAGSPTTWFRGGDLSTDPNVTGSTTTAGTASAGESIPAQGDSLELTTSRPISLDALQAGQQAEGTYGPQSDVAEVLWRLERDPDGSLALVRRERTPADPTLDPTQDPSVLRTVMSRSVTAMQVYCYDGTQSQWLEQWDAALPLENSATVGAGQSSSSASGTNAPAGMPQAVQVLLTFASGSTNRGGLSLNQSTAPALPLSVIVAMPGAEEQLLQEQMQQTAGGIGG